MSIKDLVAVKGKHSTLGYIANADNISDEDAVMVSTLRQAGAVLFCKTTMPQTGMAIETSSPLYGTTMNPYNRNLSAGGSSGGEGALVALRGSPIGLGTDIGGSIRVPCAFNGLYGIRPSTRRISYKGGMSTVFGQISVPPANGPLCHSLDDVELICKVGIDAKHYKVDPNVVPIPWKANVDIPKKLTIGVMYTDGYVIPHPPVLRGLRETAEKLKAAGHDGLHQ